MTEKNAAGIKEAVFAVLWAAAILIAYDLTDTALRLYASGPGDSGPWWNMSLTVCAIAAGCVVVYFVLTRYAASFTYEAGKRAIRLTRKIGHRERIAEIKYSDIISFSRERPQNMPKPVRKFGKTVFSGKNAYYITYKNGSAKETVIFEPSEKMAEEISARMKEG